MRPAKFLFALLFGAAVVIAFLKLLFFVVLAAAVFGTLFFAFRAARFLAFRSGRAQAGFAPQQYAPPVRLGGYGPQHAWPNAGPRPFQLGEKRPIGRHIEVL